MKEQEGRAESYKLIADELEFVSSNYLTPIKYLEKELFVDTKNSDENEFPVLLMDWVEGKTLDKYLRENLDDRYALEILAYRFSQLAQWLMPQPFAHGDLKPDNILVREDGTLVLVDYDGMYVPAMKGQKARELGSPDFRHPLRTEDDFDEHIDDFSLVSILLSLKAISVNPALLAEYGATDRLVFSEKDYRSLSECEKNTKLLALNNLDINRLLGLILLAYTEENLSNVSFKLLYVTKPQWKNSHVSKVEKKKDTIVQNKEKSRFQRAFEVVEAELYFSLAVRYAKGMGIQQDYTQALEYINKAEEKGDTNMKEKCIQARTYILAKMADGNH